MTPETQSETTDAERLNTIKELCLLAAENRTVNKNDRALYRMLAGIADGSVKIKS